MSIEKILELERLTHAQKLEHWGGPHPWNGLRLPKRLRPIKLGHIQMDGSGNILRIPPVIGRPCFGQVTAVLRHGGHQPIFNPRRRTYEPSRCMRCGVKDACEFVVEERLRATPEIDEAYREWKRAGGRNSTWSKFGPGGAARLRYRDLIHLLRTTVSFRSRNDAIVIAHYEQVLEQRREKERERKRLYRLRKSLERARAGDFDAEVLRIVEHERIFRQVEHMQLRKRSDAPRWLKLTPSNSSLFDSQVWLAKTLLQLRGKEPNPSNTAAEMQRRGFHENRKHNALRSSVARALARVAKLEAMEHPSRSGRVWPQFGRPELRQSLEDLSKPPLGVQSCAA